MTIIRILHGIDNIVNPIGKVLYVGGWKGAKYDKSNLSDEK